MRAVMLEVDPKLVAERARLGLDGQDEMWDGELHMVPPASGPHQRFGTRLIHVLMPLADGRGLIVSHETGLFRTQDDYRVPDLAFYRSEDASHRGAEGAELVVEIRSPGDESVLKVPWYFARGCREVLIVDRDTIEVALHGPDGPVSPARSDVLGCTFVTVHGPALRIECDGGSAVVERR